ncbi:hypothetical protein GEMRC1_011021 [Eukaryota sp. GEM-RC1]
MFNLKVDAHLRMEGLRLPARMAKWVWILISVISDRIPSLLEKYRVSDADSSSTPHSESHDVVVTASPLPILPRRNSFNKESIPDVVPVPQMRSTEVVEEIRKLQETFAKQQSRRLEAEQKLLFEKELLARKMSLSPEDRGNKVVLCGM